MTETLSEIVFRGARGRTQPALYVGIAGDAPRTAPARIALAGIDRVDVGRGEHTALVHTQVDGGDVVQLAIADARMSSKHLRITRVETAWIAEDLQSKNGTRVGGRAITRHTLEDGDALLVGRTMLVFRECGGEAGDLVGAPPSAAPGLATLSAALLTQFAELAKAARSTVPIEITGESGTGKELVARAIHALSARRGRFAAMNCGAVPATLLEGELFGHKKGAYTGAADEREGIVRSADGGTLFLDELAELPPASQAALLRVLQEGEVVPLGADRPVKVDLRVVTATHKNLDAEVAANRFRADLRARVLGVQIALPPLRERREDLALLVAALLDRHAVGREVRFASDAVEALYAYTWPLNIRELERALAAALAVADDRIELRHLPPALRAPPAPAPVDPEQLSAEDHALRDELVAAIARHAGNLAAVARELGKDRTQIRRWMKRFGLARD